MAVFTDKLYRIWNGNEYGFEVGPDADSTCVEIRYFEGSFNSKPKATMTFGIEDAKAVQAALADVANFMGQQNVK